MKPDCSIFQAVMPILQWFTLILGWFVIDRHNNQRESRKEKRSIVDRLLAELDALEGIAISFHTADHQQTEVARELKVRLDRMAKLIRREDLLKLKVFNPRMVELRQAITMQNFDTPDFVPQMHNSEILLNISTAKDNLTHDLERHFNAVFR